MLPNEYRQVKEASEKFQSARSEFESKKPSCKSKRFDECVNLRRRQENPHN